MSSKTLNTGIIALLVTLAILAITMNTYAGDGTCDKSWGSDWSKCRYTGSGNTLETMNVLTGTYYCRINGVWKTQKCSGTSSTETTDTVDGGCPSSWGSEWTNCKYVGNNYEAMSAVTGTYHCRINGVWKTQKCSGTSSTETTKTGDGTCDKSWGIDWSKCRYTGSGNTLEAMQVSTGQYHCRINGQWKIGKCPVTTTTNCPSNWGSSWSCKKVSGEIEACQGGNCWCSDGDWETWKPGKCTGTI